MKRFEICAGVFGILLMSFAALGTAHAGCQIFPDKTLKSIRLDSKENLDPQYKGDFRVYRKNVGSILYEVELSRPDNTSDPFKIVNLALWSLDGNHRFAQAGSNENPVDVLSLAYSPDSNTEIEIDCDAYDPLSGPLGQ